MRPRKKVYLQAESTESAALLAYALETRLPVKVQILVGEIAEGLIRLECEDRAVNISASANREYVFEAVKKLLVAKRGPKRRAA